MKSAPVLSWLKALVREASNQLSISDPLSQYFYSLGVWLCSLSATRSTTSGNFDEVHID